MRRDDKGRAFAVDVPAAMAVLRDLMPAHVAFELIDGISDGIAGAYLALPDGEDPAAQN